MLSANVASNINLALNIRIKVNEKNNVIFLKCEGFETELFMPTIIEGRLSIINVVPHRRCSCTSTSHICLKNQSLNPHLISDQNSFTFRLSTSSNRQFCTSTPEQRNVAQNVERENSNMLENSLLSLSESEQCVVQTRSKSLQSRNIAKTDDRTKLENNDLSVVGEEPPRFPSPEPMRKAVPTINNRSLRAIRNSIPNETKQTNEEMANELMHSVANLCNSSNMECPQTPPSQHTSLNLAILSNVEYLETISSASKSLLESITSASQAQVQWRKVLTPKRTYSRHQYSPNESISSFSSSSLKDNSTQGIKVRAKIVKIQPKKYVHSNINHTISPRSFKMQLQNENTVDQRRALRDEFLKLCSQNKRKSAFHFFTTPTMQTKCFSPKLIQMYRSRCVNKGSSTYPKYKKLARKKLPTVLNENVGKPIVSKILEHVPISIDE